MTTLLISDLHLDDSRPEITGLFLEFLSGRAQGAGALYILGDLFDAWVGDDDDAPLAGRVKAALHGLASSGTAVRIMRGNRDFLLGDRFAEESGARLLPAEAIAELAGEPTLLMHGDQLCSDDLAYQRMRETLDSPDWRRAFLGKGLEERRTFAATLRATSSAATALKKDSIMDVNQGAVAEAMTRHGVRCLIHGHTHRPGHYEVQCGQDTLGRIVLADWHHQGSVLVCEDHRPPYFETLR